MQLTNVISIASFTAFTAAAPSTLETRQGSGGAYVAVGLKYRAGGCVDSNLIFADPIFGNGNVCQPLARQPDAEPIVSYKTVGTSPGCTVALFDGPNCSGTRYDAPLNGCVTGNKPFVSTFVTCPN